MNLSATLRVDADVYADRITRLKPQAGDVLYTREGERYGIAAMVPEKVDVCLGQRMMHFRFKPDQDARFMMWQLNAGSTLYQALLDVMGATSPHINVETIRNFILLEPPKDEQVEIALYVDKEIAAYDLLAKKADCTIDTLRERRSSLISAAVTGKIDVRRLLVTS